MTEDSKSIANQLFSAAEARAAQHGVSFGQSASNCIRTLTETAAKTILRNAIDRNE
jgi:hypothetical protein